MPKKKAALWALLIVCILTAVREFALANGSSLFFLAGFWSLLPGEIAILPLGYYHGGGGFIDVFKDPAPRFADFLAPFVSLAVNVVVYFLIVRLLSNRGARNEGRRSQRA